MRPAADDLVLTGIISRAECSKTKQLSRSARRGIVIANCAARWCYYDDKKFTAEAEEYGFGFIDYF